MNRVCSTHEAPAAITRFLYLYDLVGVQRFTDGPPLILANCPCGSTVAFEAREEDL